MIPPAICPPAFSVSIVHVSFRFMSDAVFPRRRPAERLGIYLGGTLSLLFYPHYSSQPWRCTGMGAHTTHYSLILISHRLHLPPTTYHRDNGITSQYSARYHIATTGSLLVRRQLTFILPHFCDGNTYPLHGLFCRHIGGQTCRRISGAVALVQTEARSGILRSLSKLYYCIDCHTVVRLGARKFRGRGIGLFVTWWGDLGDGRAGDEKWANIARPTENIHGGGRVKYSYMDIINAFGKGNTDYVDFDGLLSPTDRKELLRLSPYVGVRK